jgi:paraquat-inducible protein B
MRTAASRLCLLAQALTCLLATAPAIAADPPHYTVIGVPGPPITDGVPFVVRFNAALPNLSPGAAVEIHGIRVGEVKRIGLEYDAAENAFSVPVDIVIEPDLLPTGGPALHTAAETYDAVDRLVRRGLRATLGSTQLLSGEALIELDIHTETPAATLDRSGAVPRIPTGPTQRELVESRLQAFLARLADLPIDKIITDVDATMDALRALATGPELRDTLVQLQGAAADMRSFASRVGPRADTLLGNLNETVLTTNRTIDRTGQTLSTLDRQVGDRSPLLLDIRDTIRELGGAARSMRLLAEYLERNPTALIVGKSDNRR